MPEKTHSSMLPSAGAAQLTVSSYGPTAKLAAAAVTAAMHRIASTNSLPRCSRSRETSSSAALAARSLSSSCCSQVSKRSNEASRVSVICRRDARRAATDPQAPRAPSLPAAVV
eukprot:CAMPEP_0171200062 /NCGR_PEP_ID=MMETSP0790-20130122/23787_1 /TAXON_ID=2925 /ORGANISM="Alexandrium catenella, Strain OF101" /LENGTH=113 /DNA_ID=CAMNT_0011665431 /DNA_START=89 /DNA_END=427 /DNA_ORIENTATION=+